MNELAIHTLQSQITYRMPSTIVNIGKSKIEFNRQIRTNTKELNKSIADITDQINAYKNKLETASDNGQINDSTYQIKKVLFIICLPS